MPTQIIDTYEVPAAPVEVEDALAPFRGQAKEPKQKMSDRAATLLRAIGEHDRANKAADAILVSWFNEQPKTVELVMDVMYRISRRNTSDIRKRAIKCFHMLSRGSKVYTIHDVTFLGELLREESSMSQTKFLARYPIDEDNSLEPVKTEVAQPVYRACKSGKKCMRFEKRKPAAAKGRGEYCSTSCAASDRARAKRLSAGQLASGRAALRPL